jgi:putative spermidine/putrescine transport system permease protein
MRSRGPIFYVLLGITVLVCTFLVLPIGIAILAAITNNYMVGISSGFTLRWLEEVWRDYSATIFASIGLAVACLACTLVVGVPAAYVLARSKSLWARIAEEILVLPLAVPGIAIALALIATYGRFTDFRQSWGIILVGHIIYTLPFMVRSVVAVMSSIDLRSLEEGAASLGAGFFRRFFTVILPNSRAGVVAGALMVLTLSIGEFNITLLLHTPTTKTLPIGLNDAYATSRLEVSSAYTSLFFLIIIPLLLSVLLAAKPRKRAQVASSSRERVSQFPERK